MRVVVIGATGNVGSALVRALAASDAVTEVVGVARRLPPDPGKALGAAKVEWQAVDISTDELDVVSGADAVVDLAWKIQPSRDEAEMRRTNVLGTGRVAEAVAAHGVHAFVYASSVGTYAPHTKDGRADETWPATGIESSTYSRHKAEVEAMLDQFERLHPDIRVVRMRTSLVFQRAAASEIHRLFLGPLLPWHLPRLARLVPNLGTLQFQATHADDIATAYVGAITSDVAGAFNVASEPVLTPALISAAVHGRTVPMTEGIMRAPRLRSPTGCGSNRVSPGGSTWRHAAPLMDTGRAHRELGWEPSRTSIDALTELLDGIGDGAGADTIPLQPR